MDLRLISEECFQIKIYLDDMIEPKEFSVIMAGFSLIPVLTNEDNFNKMKCVMKPGGKLAFSIWGQQNQGWLTDIVQKYAETNNSQIEKLAEELMK